MSLYVHSIVPAESQRKQEVAPPPTAAEKEAEARARRSRRLVRVWNQERIIELRQ